MKTYWGKLLGLGLGVGILVTLNAGAMTYYVNVSNTAPVSPYTNWLKAATNIQDAIDTATNSDLILVTNGLYNTGGRAVNGYTLTNRVAVTKPLTVQSVNGPAVTVIQGYQVPGTKTGNEAVRCVYMTNNATLIGFTLTNGASRDLFVGDVIHEQSAAGVWCESTNVVVSNCVIIANIAPARGGGIYLGTLNNCLIVSNQNSWSGGGGGGACGSLLNNCTLTGNNGSVGGAAYQCILNSCIISNNAGDYGGGAYSSKLTNCTIIGNSTHPGGNGGGVENSTLFNCMVVSNSASSGGGAYSGSFYDCLIIGNQATNGSGGGAMFSALTSCLIRSNVATNTPTSTGGGVYQGTVINCTIVSNTATSQGGVYGSLGGAYGSTISNCIIYYNKALNGTDNNYLSNSILNYCCTTPLSTNGTGNFINAPLFVNLLTNNYRLQSSSLCINAGNNSVVIGTNDLDGNPRIAGGTVDIGAYEYQNPTSILSYFWAQQYAFSINGTDDSADPDNDGMNNYQEWKAGTNPRITSSVLKLKSPTNSVAGTKVTWQSVSGVTYYLQRATNLAAQPPFTTYVSNLTGLAVSTSYTDTTATNATPYFYRVGVQ